MMKLIIDIDEDYYEMIKHDDNDFKPYKLIAKGTPLKEHMTRDKLDVITYWIRENIMRNPNIMLDDAIRGDDIYRDIDLIEVIASLHNMLYKEVTGEYYDYMFHWANKVGSSVYDDMFKPEEEKRERI